MPVEQSLLTPVPEDPRDRELWLQHAAGFILFRDVREYAIKSIDRDLSAECREVVIKGIDDAVYGLMMVLDGVTGALSNQEQSVELGASVALRDKSTGKAIVDLRLSDGDGMCMGYHYWRDGHFGDLPPAE